MTGLSALLAQATPRPWEHRVWGHDTDEWPDNRVSVGRATGHGEAIVLNPRYGERTQDLANARLIALAPDAVSLLIDIVAWMTEKYPEAAVDPDRVCSPPAVLLARFAELDRRAADASR